jgi:hypothetical protein
MEQILKNIEKKSEKNKLLTLYDIEVIIKKVIPKILNDFGNLNRILSILNGDINLRNKKFGVNCIEELYFVNNLLLESMRIPRPNEKGITGLIKERLVAITLNEYRNQYRLTTYKFIDNPLSYKECMKRTKKLDEYCNRLLKEITKF